MNARELAPGTWALVFEAGDEAFALLSAWVEERGVGAARLTAIGAFERAVVGYFAWERRDYERIPVDEQVEVLSLVGDVALDPDGKPVVHAHVVLGRRDGSTVGGHLLEGHVRPTLEVVLDEVPAHLRKRHDPESGLALIDLPK
jgi:predicted DNA-binding protein with PD1-like motif